METDSPQRRKIRILVATVIVLASGCLALGLWVVMLTTSGRVSGASAENNKATVGDVRLHGEVFVVTKGAQSIKLGLVSVGLITLDTINHHLDSKRQEAAKEHERLRPELETATAEYERLKQQANEAHQAFVADSNDTRHRIWELVSKDASKALEHALTLAKKKREWESGDFYFRDLPQPFRATKTDADGKFELDVPREGEYALAAYTTRLAGEGVEKYFWLIRVSGQTARNEKFLLSNDNMTSSSSPISLIRTED